jgi:hypothetical protein
MGVLGVISLGAIARLLPVSRCRRFWEGVRDVRRRRQVLVLVAGAAAVWGAGPLAGAGGAGVAAWGAAVRAGAVRSAGSWGKAIGVPGLAALNKGGYAPVLSMSCVSAGNCVAGGYYLDRHQRSQGFAVVERDGRWGRAIQLPGLGALNTGRAGPAPFFSVSCGSAGNCAAGGYYADISNSHQGFAVSWRNGRWGRATQIPGLAALNKDGYAGVFSLSCTPAGSCTVGGTYEDRNGNIQGFVT